MLSKEASLIISSETGYISEKRFHLEYNLPFLFCQQFFWIRFTFFLGLAPELTNGLQ